jgi:hypothetical protein
MRPETAPGRSGLAVGHFAARERSDDGAAETPSLTLERGMLLGVVDIQGLMVLLLASSPSSM